VSVASAAQPPIQVFAFGTHPVGTTLSFTLPENAASFTIIEQAVSAPFTATFDFGMELNGPEPLALKDPDGTAILNPGPSPSDPTQAPLYHLSSSPGVAALTLPSSSLGLSMVAAGLRAGTWSFEVSDLAYVCSLSSSCASGGGSVSSTYDVTVLVKAGGETSTVPLRGRVDITFNLIPGGDPPLSSATAEGDADVQRLVSSLAILLRRAKIDLGTVSYVDVPSAIAARAASGVHLSDPSVCGDLSQLFASAPAGRQMNIFLVPTFLTGSSGSGSTISGVDGSVPGPATLSPTPQSGVAASLANLRFGRANCHSGLALNCGPLSDGTVTCCGADLTAYVVAHELGHFLGLYHVTEEHGTRFDPLRDTATCPCQSCAPHPKQCADADPAPASPHSMGVRECDVTPTCSGGANLMFWLLDDESRGDLTFEQQQIMRANPAVF
jgi:hypothetical protein